MRFTGQVRIRLQGQVVFRKPSFWDKVKGAFGADVDLKTGEQQLTADVLGIAESVQLGLKRANVDNAVSLVVDQDVVFRDTEGRANDADLLVNAARQSTARFQKGFNVVRAVFEHEEAGVQTLVEATFRAKYGKGEPTAVVAIGGRMSDLRPKPGETADQAKERIAQIINDPGKVPAAKQVFEHFVERVGDGMRAAFPDAEIEVDPANLQVVKPGRESVQDLAGRGLTGASTSLREQPYYPQRGYYGAGYDPWGVYYRDPLDTFVSLMIIDTMLHPHYGYGYGGGYGAGYGYGGGYGWSSYGSPVHIVHEGGRPICDASQIQQNSEAFQGVSEAANHNYDEGASDHTDLGNYGWGDPAPSYSAGAEGGAAGGDWDCAGAADAGSWGGDSGGDSGGGDAGGSWDCASSDCTSDCTSDCSWDCSSDCTSDCSFDCSSDCGGDW